MPLPNLELHQLEEVVLDKCASFVQLGIWPNSERLNYRAWLRNFSSDEDKKFALHLLNAFSFYNSELCAGLFFGAIQSLSTTFSSFNTVGDPLGSWSSFLEKAIFVPVEGELPNITDSGMLLASMLRKSLWIPEGSIRPFDQLLEDALLGTLSNRPVIFFDDFVGSGTQFFTMMTTKKMGVEPHILLKSRGITAFYCCFVATSYGLANIKLSLPEIHVSPAHIIDDSYSVVAPTSKVWPNELRPRVKAFIRRVSRVAQIPTVDRLGFHSLALTLAFDHTIPDATLPLFYQENANWHPLMRRL